MDIYTLRNAKGAEARIITYGGIVVSLKVPDRNGELGDVVLGYDNLDGLSQGPRPYFGALIGRYGNRIAKGKFTLDGKEYTLATNNGPNALHGGLKGFDKVVWTAKSLTSARRSRAGTDATSARTARKAIPATSTSRRFIP